MRPCGRAAVRQEAGVQSRLGGGAGITCRPDDPGLLADAFLELARATPDARAAMGSAGRDYVAREHNVTNLGETLHLVVEGRLPAGR